MARLQILELPTVERPDGTEEKPFVLVIDQLGGDAVDAVSAASLSTAELIGARAVFAFEDTVEIPANEVPVDPDGYPLTIRIEGDFEQFREQVQDEIRKAQAELRDAINQE